MQLLVLHFKRDHLLLLCWLILFGYVTNTFSVKFGVPILFLYPEYFGEANFLSFMITGFTLGGFITAFNLYTYTLHAFRFPFLATLARPYLKFTINNAVIPIIFLLTYIYHSVSFQLFKELVPPGDVLVHILSLVVGVALFASLSYLYFTRTNTDVIKLLGKEPDEVPPPTDKKGRDKRKWFRINPEQSKWFVHSYMATPIKFKLARSSAHYDAELLRKVFWQNHINGSIFEVVLILSFLAFGAFSEVPLFSIPAAASAFVLFTMLLMLISAVFSWLKGWTFTLLIALLLLGNYASKNYDNLFYDAHAFGLDYSNTAATKYDLQTIDALADDKAAYQADRQHGLRMLERWKRKNQALSAGSGKPKMVLVCTSGGGLRSMLWTFRSLQYADSLLDGTLMDRTFMITGSSGGMIGASYFRELYAKSLVDEKTDLQSDSYLDDVSKDILNPVIFSFATNDLFIRYRRVKDGDRSYVKDRGYAFERRLNENTHNVLDTRLSDMREPEENGTVPMLVISPTSMNDGRRLLISAQPISYLVNNSPGSNVTDQALPENIEFTRMFAAQDPMNLKLTSALRMSATFPFIMPVVSLPSEPKMQVMDAGIRDNYGLSTTLHFLFQFREWIAENTGGVVILQTRDKQKDLKIDPIDDSMFARLFSPVGSVYGNFVKVQDNTHDEIFMQASAWFPGQLDLVRLELRQEEDEGISLSWHLSKVEQEQVLEAIRTETNQQAFDLLQQRITGGRTSTPIVASGGRQ